jgi:hypothetical protein
MSKKLSDFLTPNEIYTINQRIDSGVDQFGILKTYKKLSKKHCEIIKSHIKERLTITYKCAKIMGYKNEPYYINEEQMIIPKYTLDSLSPEEKEIYNQICKNNE